MKAQQDPGAHAVVDVDKAEQDVLCAYGHLLEIERLAKRTGQNLLGTRCEWDLAQGLLLQHNRALDLGAHAVGSDADALEDPRGDASILAEQAEQDVLGPDAIALQLASLVLGGDDDPASMLCETVERVLSERVEREAASRLRIFV